MGDDAGELVIAGRGDHREHTALTGAHDHRTPPEPRPGPRGGVEGIGNKSVQTQQPPNARALAVPLGVDPHPYVMPTEDCQARVDTDEEPWQIARCCSMNWPPSTRRSGVTWPRSCARSESSEGDDVMTHPRIATGLVAAPNLPMSDIRMLTAMARLYRLDSVFVYDHFHDVYPSALWDRDFS